MQVKTVPDTDNFKDRIFQQFTVGFRVYREQGKGGFKKDDVDGRYYDGWSRNQDEKIAMFCPRIMPWATKKGKFEMTSDVVEEDIDDYIKPEEGLEKVFAVPRPPRLCMSSVYIHLMNVFGNLGGFDLILDLVKNAPVVEQAKTELELDTMKIGALSQCLTMPNLVFHKDFITKNGEAIIESVKSRFVSATDKSLKDVSKEQIDAIIKNAESLQKRWKSQTEREQWSEELRLELSVKGLTSDFVVRRINAMKDLNKIIESNTLYSTKSTFSAEFLN